MIDPDEEIEICKGCGVEFSYNRRYGLRKSNGYCCQCNDDMQDVAYDMKFQERRDNNADKG